MKRRSGCILAALALAGFAAGGCDDLSGAGAGATTSTTDLDRAGLMDLGKRVYGANCLTCHQFDGSGVPALQPALADSAVVVGDPADLVRLVWFGIGDPDAPGALPASGEWSQVMGGYSFLGEERVAAVVTYIRGSFGNDAPEVTVPEVRRIVRPLAREVEGGG